MPTICSENGKWTYWNFAFSKTYSAFKPRMLFRNWPLYNILILNSEKSEFFQFFFFFVILKAFIKSTQNKIINHLAKVSWSDPAKDCQPFCFRNTCYKSYLLTKSTIVPLPLVLWVHLTIGPSVATLVPPSGGESSHANNTVKKCCSIPNMTQ